MSFLFIFSMDLAGFTFYVVSVLAILFSVYMLVVLYKFEKNGWIFGFLIWMGISFIPVLFMTGHNLLTIILQYAPLLFFALYALALKEKVGEWLLDLDFERQTKIQTHNRKYS